MNHIFLSSWAKQSDFPFFIHRASHEEECEIHNHVDFSELVIVLNGTATHIINSEESFTKKGDVFVFNGDTTHGFKDTHNFQICNIMYKPERLYQVGNDLKKSPGFQALFVLEPFYRKEHKFKSKLQLQISSLEYINEIIDNMIYEYNTGNEGYQTIIYSYFMTLVVYLSRQYNNNGEKESQNLLHLAKAISYMEDHYLDSITIEDLADKARLSARHFNRIFKENYCTTPMNYIINLRLQHARSLLKRKKLNISEIAIQSGFYDSNYFTRQFKLKFGISPREFRNSL